MKAATRRDRRASLEAFCRAGAGAHTARKILSGILAGSLIAATVAPARAQPAPSVLPNTQPATRPAAISPELTGRTVEEVRIIGKTKPLSATLLSEISAQVRTREGTTFDPIIVESDYQRVYRLRRFSNVEAKVEPTRTGVIVIFEVSEQSQIREIRFKGNEGLDTRTLQDVADMRVGEAIDPFRLSVAMDAMQRAYQGKNFPYTRVSLNQELLREGIVQFDIVEGPKVRVRKVQVIGNRTFTDAKVEDQVKTKPWFLFFASGRFDPDQLERDVAAIRQFYENKGFFDVRVGRKVVVSPDQSEVMVQFLVEEGARYFVDKVSFRGNTRLSEEELRKNLKLTEGRVYEQELTRRDIRQIVRAYSPYGYIYLANDLNPDEAYMRVTEERIFRRDAGKVEVVYNIHEGRPFQLGRVIVKGNAHTQDKVIVREIRVAPGQLYNSYEIQRAQDRIRATNLFNSVTITPIRTDTENDDVRDLLVEVSEAQTAKFIIGAGVTSNSGIMGQITYEQKNFDIANVPASWDELWSKRAFTGAGQTFRVTLEPGTELTRARVDFIEPYILDQPYSLGISAYISQRQRQHWDENRFGGRVSVGKRFNDEWSARVTARGEDVEITDIRRPEERAREILELEGHSTITSLGLEVKRSTIDSPILPSTGSSVTMAWERAGLIGGDFDFDKLTLEGAWYTTIYEDLLDRKTVLALRGDIGYISGDAPFFERFYAGGIGSVRGFRYRGISPRDGIVEDPIGGDFMVTGTAELNFPIAGESLRGVVFTDVGFVEEDFEIGTIRSSVGFGFRLTLPFFGQIPLAADFGFPITKDDQDRTRIFSFSLGLLQ